MTAELAQEITRQLNGDWCGRYGLIPGPGHSRHDRSVSVKPHPQNPGDVIVHSFAGQDWREIRDWLCSQGFLPRFEGGRRNG